MTRRSLKVAKPAHVFEREWEWEALTSFATGTQAEVALGVVSGRRSRDLLTDKGYDTPGPVLAGYSGTGFDDDLRAEARKARDVLLVDLPMLYGQA